MKVRTFTIVVALTALVVSPSLCSCTQQADNSPTKNVMNTYSDLIRQADKDMRCNEARRALQAYQSAWSHCEKTLSASEEIWVLLSMSNAAVRCGEFEQSLDALSTLLEKHKKSGVVVGNPLFHLLVGLSYHGLKVNPEGETDNFARALICGGPEIFSGEDPAHLKRMKKVLRPPAELGTWTGYRGCSRDLLNGASGYLRELITQKIGVAPPYS